MNIQRKTAPSEERRRHVRRRPPSIVGVKLGSENGGILLNLGTGGLSFQAVAGLNPDQYLILHFRFFETGEKITVSGRVAWLGPTRKQAGICFKDLSDRTEQSIAGWIARQEKSSNATELKVGSPVSVVTAAGDTRLLRSQVAAMSIPSGGTALDPQQSPATALLSELRLDDSLQDPASSTPSMPLKLATSFPSPIPTNAPHPKEHSAAPTVNPIEVPSEPLKPILQTELASPSGPSKEFPQGDRVRDESPMPPSATDAASEDKWNAIPPWIPYRPGNAIPLWIPPVPLPSPQGKRRRQVLIIAGLAALGVLVLILMPTKQGTYQENTDSHTTPVLPMSPPAAMALDVSSGITGHTQPQTMLPATPSGSVSSPAPIPVPPQIVPRPKEPPWLATIKKMFSGADDSRAYDPAHNRAVDGISVWTNSRSGFYYCADSPYFAGPEPGSLMTQGNALQSGYQPKLGIYCR